MQLAGGQGSETDTFSFSPFLSVAARSLISASLCVPSLSADLIWILLCLWAQNDCPAPQHGLRASL